MELKQQREKEKKGRFYLLLIVPYGIETLYGTRVKILYLHLLIVPYGIETLARLGVHPLPCTFNRTLWN